MRRTKALHARCSVAGALHAQVVQCMAAVWQALLCAAACVDCSKVCNPHMQAFVVLVQSWSHSHIPVYMV
jgi:hypothetical protein